MSSKSFSSTLSSANIRDVARRAGVSIGTVSLALNDRPYVSPERRKKIKAVAAQLGYVPNLLGKALNRRHCGIVGVVVPVAQSLNFSNIIAGINGEVEDRGRSIFVSFSQDRPEIEARMLKLFRQLHVNGVVLAAAPGRDNVPLLRELIGSGMAVVQIERRLKGIKTDFVGSQNQEAARAVVHRLLAKGYRRVGFVTTSLTYSVNDERFQGYQQALSEAGIAIDPRWVLRLLVKPGAKSADVVEAMASYLHDIDTPSAILWCASFVPLMARLIRQRGWVNGRDADVILLEIASEMDVGGQSFEYVMQDGTRIGREAARLVLERSEETSETSGAAARMSCHVGASEDVRFPCIQTHVSQHLLHGVLSRSGATPAGSDGLLEPVLNGSSDVDR